MFKVWYTFIFTLGNNSNSIGVQCLPIILNICDIKYLGYLDLVIFFSSEQLLAFTLLP